MYKVFGARRTLSAAEGRKPYCAQTAVPANWQRATPAIEYSSPMKDTLSVAEPVGVRYTMVPATSSSSEPRTS